MNLAIFDIDGTLVRTGELNQQLYRQVFKDLYDIPLENLDWTKARYSTDSGLMPFVFEQAWGRLPSEAEVDRVREAFLAYWSDYLDQAPIDQFAVPGAPAAFNLLRGHRQWQVGVASGGWRVLGEMKLGHIGVRVSGLPRAFCDESPARTEIIALARAKAEQAHGGHGFERVVYVGDAFWDVAAAGRLGMGFVGLGNGDGEKKLREAGAEVVLTDYTDLDGFMTAMSAAPVPVPTKLNLD